MVGLTIQSSQAQTYLHKKFSRDTVLGRLEEGLQDWQYVSAAPGTQVPHAGQGKDDEDQGWTGSDSSS
jgi:hypothetical protein